MAAIIRFTCGNLNICQADQSAVYRAINRLLKVPSRSDNLPFSVSLDSFMGARLFVCWRSLLSLSHCPKPFLNGTDKGRHFTQSTIANCQLPSLRSFEDYRLDEVLHAK